MEQLTTLNMIKLFKRLFGLNKLQDVLFETKKLTIDGIRFTIRKIDPIHYMSGANVTIKNFDVYEAEKSAKQEIERIKKEDPSAIEKRVLKIREHQKEVILASVIRPVLVRDEEPGENIYIGDLYRHAGLADKLYQEIMYFTYGKKKVKSLTSPLLDM